LKQVIEKYPATRSKPMSSSMSLHLARLGNALGDRRFTSITPEDLRDWLKALKPGRLNGSAPSAFTIRSHCKSIRTLWSAAVVQRWASYNAAAAVPIPQISGEGDEVNILTVDEARRLFAANHDALCVGRLALEAFGGLRYTSAARLTRNDILPGEKGIVMPGRKHKSGKRHFVSGWPPNLFKWIRHARPECWEIGERAYLDLKRAAFVRAGLKPDVPETGKALRPDEVAVLETRKNALRHSFATYHLAAFQNQQLTVYLMTKTSISSLNDDYRGRATRSDALAYFQIAP
jgi:integrase